MSFIFGFLDVLLTTILLYDTLSLAYQIRKDGESDTKDYVRVCLSWILFLTICNLFTCERKGLFGALIRILFFFAKACVTIPKLGGTLRLYDYLIEKGKAKEWYYTIEGLVKSKLCKGCKCSSANNISDTNEPETTTPS